MEALLDDLARPFRSPDGQPGFDLETGLEGITDLPGADLGRASLSTIYLDTDAAGSQDE